MKAGQASRTAVMVCSGRAAAQGRTSVARFNDPTALALLPEEARVRVERFRAGGRPANRRERMRWRYMETSGRVMAARTVEIDDAIRGVAAPQVVILGAGLDGRAWRMPELGEAVVFEVDHPDSQHDKRERAAALTPMAREIRFVPVDFTRDDLQAELVKAGHDAGKPTVWIWEGVVMYLARPAIEATLSVIARRSAPGSRLAVLYHAPAATLWLIGFLVRRMGEPLRSAFTPAQMRALLGHHGFTVRRDRDVPTIAAELSSDPRKLWMTRHLRIAVADRLTV